MFEPRPIRMSMSFIFFLYTALLSISIDCTFGITYEWNKTEVYPCTCLKFMHVCVCVLSLSMILLIPNNCTSYALPNQVGIQAFGTGLSFSFYLISILILETYNRTLSSFDGRMAYLFWIEEYIGIAIRGTQLTNTIHWIEWECSLYWSCCMSAVHEKLYHMGHTFIHLPWQKHFLSF